MHHRPASPYPSTGCQYNERELYQKEQAVVQDWSLSDCLGADGLTRLLTLLDEQLIPMAEVLELIKRLHTPGYEQARLYINRAISEDIIERHWREDFFYQDQLNIVIAWANKHKDKFDEE